MIHALPSEQPASPFSNLITDTGINAVQMARLTREFAQFVHERRPGPIFTHHPYAFDIDFHRAECNARGIDWKAAWDPVAAAEGVVAKPHGLELNDLPRPSISDLAEDATERAFKIKEDQAKAWDALIDRDLLGKGEHGARTGRVDWAAAAGYLHEVVEGHVQRARHEHQGMCGQPA